ATCHRPENGFADRVPDHGGRNAPTLLNVVYNDSQFHDGRATYLEEVVARTLVDERPAPESAAFRHAWGGVVVRLLEDRAYRERFHNAFGASPSQDTVGKALAAYLRTLLCGDSLHDRALAAQAARKGAQLEKADYEKVLDADALKALGREGKAPAEVADELMHGYRVFHDLDVERREKKLPPTNCAVCH